MIRYKPLESSSLDLPKVCEARFSLDLDNFSKVEPFWFFRDSCAFFFSVEELSFRLDELL